MQRVSSALTRFSVDTTKYCFAPSFMPLSIFAWFANIGINFYYEYANTSATNTDHLTYCVQGMALEDITAFKITFPDCPVW